MHSGKRPLSWQWMRGAPSLGRRGRTWPLAEMSMGAARWSQSKFLRRTLSSTEAIKYYFAELVHNDITSPPLSGPSEIWPWKVFSKSTNFPPKRAKKRCFWIKKGSETAKNGTNGPQNKRTKNTWLFLHKMRQCWLNKGRCSLFYRQFVWQNWKLRIWGLPLQPFVD